MKTSKAYFFLVFTFFLLFSLSFIDARVEIELPYAINIDARSGITNLSELDDVNITSPNNEDVLAYNSTSGFWINQALASISKWIIDSTSNYLYNDTTTLYFNETHLNNTINQLIGSVSNIFDQVLNTTSNVTFNNITVTQNVTAAYFNGDGSNLTGITAVAGNPFNQSLNTTDNVTFNNITVTQNVTAAYFNGDGSNLTGITAVAGNPFNQSLNTTDNVTFNNITVTQNVTAAYFNGDGSNLTGITAVAGNPFDQVLNTTFNVTFNNVTVTENVSALWYNGLFNFTTQGNYLSFDGWNLTFDEDALNVTIGIYNTSMKSYVDGRDVLGDLHTHNSSNITDQNLMNVNNSNSTVWWASLNGWVSGWFENDGDELSFNETKLNETGDSRYVNIDGDNMTGTLNISETGDAFIVAGASYFGTDPSEVRTPLNPGDLGVDGRILANNTIQISPQKYGIALTITNHGDDEPDKSVLISGASATLNTTTGVFCDFGNSPFSENNATTFTLVNLFSSQLGFSLVPFKIIEFINSSCVNVNLAIFGTDTVPDVTMIAYGFGPNPIFFVTDNGFVSTNIGDSEDAQFLIETLNATGGHKFVVDTNVSGDGVHNTHIEGDVNGFDNYLNLHSSVVSDFDLNSSTTTNLQVDVDLSNANNGTYVAIDLPIIDDGNGMDIIGLRFSSLFDDLFTVGSPETLDIAYYDNTTNISERTGEFLSQSSNIEIFEEQNSIIYIGNTINFTSISVSVSTGANPSITPSFFYCNSTGQYETLSATDTTAGFTTSGTISFTSPSNRGVCNKDINGVAFANTTNFTYIAIQRTRAILPTIPIENIFGISGDDPFVYFRDDIYKINCVDSAPLTCTASSFGATYCDSTSEQQFFCDGSAWTATAGFSPGPHNSLTGLQGGTTAEYYHLTSSEHSELSSWIDDVTLSDGGNISLGVANITANEGYFNNIYNKTEVTTNITSANTSMKAYVDSVDTATNTSMKAYVDSVDTATNTSMKAYVDGQDIVFNNSMKAYVDSVNDSQQTWVDLWFVRFTELVGQVGNWTADKLNYYNKTEIETNLTTYNNSMKAYVDSVNDSQATWVTNTFVDLTGDNMTGNLNVTGNVTAAYFNGDGSNLTGITAVAGNPFDQVLNTTFNVTFNNVTVTENVSALWYNGLFNFTTQGNYLDFNGWNLTFDEDALNVTIGIYNTSMKSYVDGQDTVFNDSMKSYVDSVDTATNTSMKTYVDGTFLNLSGTNANQNINISPYNLTLGTKIEIGGGSIIDNGTHLIMS